MRRLIAMLSLIILLAGACTATSTNGDGDENGNGNGNGADNGEAQPSALASWALLDELTTNLGLDAAAKTQLGGQIMEDGTDDTFHPNPDAEFVPMENIDIERVVAFHVDLTQEEVDTLFNATEYPCDTSLGGFPSTWCPGGDPTFEPGRALVACGEVRGSFPYDQAEEGTNYEYLFAFPDPGDPSKNYKSAYDNDLFIDASYALVVRYGSGGPSVLAWDSQRGFIEGENLSGGIRFIVDFTGEQSSVCLVADVKVIGDYPAYPIRWGTFCGDFNRGSADWYPEGGFHRIRI